jgi:hypothetical protein
MEVMMSERVQQAILFVDELQLPAKPRIRRSRSEESPTAATVVIPAKKEQAMVVGADIVSFVAGTDLGMRRAIMNCTLLAQLAAKIKAPPNEGIRKWYEAYFDILGRLGWLIENHELSLHVETANNFDAQHAILSVAAAFLGQASDALKLVRSTLESLEQMSTGQWMTIFKRESQTEKAAHFQVTVAEPVPPDDTLISMMAFELNATGTLTQVLFFKFQSMKVDLWHSSRKVRIDRNLLTQLTQTIANKVADYVQKYVENIPLSLPAGSL